MPNTTNWERLAERAARMTDSELHYAHLDCVRAAAAMDALDAVDGLDRAGKYRDEASVYLTAMRTR